MPINKSRNHHRPPQTAIVEFCEVRYALFQCEGPDCGKVHREAMNTAVNRLANGDTLHGTCDDCGQHLQIRKPQGVYTPPRAESGRDVASVLENIRQNTSGLSTT